MRNLVRTGFLLAGLVALTACGREDAQLDDALRADLSLAASQNPYMQPYMSPAEMGYAGGYAPQYGYPPQYAPVQRYNAAQVYPAPAPRVIQRAPQQVVYRQPASAPAPTQRVKHTKRDAIIGGVAGAAIGAVTSRDKLKGAVIGAAAGGLLGAVIGNNVDVKRIPIP
jgi:hypothetical protein